MNIALTLRREVMGDFVVYLKATVSEDATALTRILPAIVDKYLETELKTHQVLCQVVSSDTRPSKAEMKAAKKAKKKAKNTTDEASFVRVHEVNDEKCVARVFAGGLGSQCTRASCSDNGLCKIHSKYDQGETPFGLITDPRKTIRPDTQKLIRWKFFKPSETDSSVEDNSENEETNSLSTSSISVLEEEVAEIDEAMGVGEPDELTHSSMEPFEIIQGEEEQSLTDEDSSSMGDKPFEPKTMNANSACIVGVDTKEDNTVVSDVVEVLVNEVVENEVVVDAENEVVVEVENEVEVEAENEVVEADNEVVEADNEGETEKDDGNFSGEYQGVTYLFEKDDVDYYVVYHVNGKGRKNKVGVFDGEEIIIDEGFEPTHEFLATSDDENAEVIRK